MLDAWALLAWLKGAPDAAGRVREILAEGERGAAMLFMSIVNLGEVFYILARQAGLDRAELFLRERRSLPIRIVPAPNRLVLDAARLKAAYPIAYGDAFAVATARHRRATLVTGDPELRVFEGGDVVPLEWIGK